MIRYQSEQPTKNWRLGIKRAFVSFNPFIVGSFLGIMLIILGGILLFGGRIYNNLIWVIPLSLLITVTWFFLYYKVKILPDFIRTRRKLLEIHLNFKKIFILKKALSRMFTEKCFIMIIQN